MFERATIGDVAEQAGVSIATVSRVVNGRYGVAPATFDRVKAVIDDLGYETSLIARSLRSQRTNVIGVLVADIEPFSAEILKGASNALRGTDYELIVYCGGHNGELVGWERRYLSRLSGTLADGTVLVTPTVADVSLNQPVVAVDPQTGASSFPTFASQNYEGALGRHPPPHRTRPHTNWVPRWSARPGVGEGARARATAPASTKRASLFDGELLLEGGFKEATSEGPAAPVAVAATAPHRHLRGQRSLGDSDDAHRCLTGPRPCPATCRSSASTTCQSPQPPTRRSRQWTSRFRVSASPRCAA